MIKTLIANNCMGGCLLSENNMEFRTPTINLQLMPEEFPRLCLYLREYMSFELEDYRAPGRSLMELHERYLRNVYGCIPNHPMGILRDIIVVFQHYDTFEEAKTKWDERKARIDYDNIGFLFMLVDEKYKRYGEEFIKLGLPNSAVLTEGFDIEGGHRYDVPPTYNRFDLIDGKRVITQNFDEKEFLRG